MIIRFGLAVTVALIALSGCNSDSLTGPQPGGEHPSHLERAGDGPDIDVPDVGTVDQPFQIRIQSLGGGCTERGRTDVSRDGSTITVRPYDVFAKPSTVCTSDLRFIDHSVSAQVSSEGVYTVRVIGIKVLGHEEREEAKYEFEITIQGADR